MTGLTGTRVSDVDVLQAGSGTPVMMLHGIGGAAESFAPQLTGLAHQHTVIAWNAPGYGNSADLPGEPTLDDYASAVLSVLRGLHAEPAHLLGVSWGGVIASRVALREPSAVRSLVLADSSRGSGRTAEGRAAMQRRVNELSSRGSAAFAQLRGPRLVAEGANAVVTKQVVDLMSRVRLPGYRNAVRVMAGTDHSGQLGDLTMPVLVVVGAEDAVTGVAESREMAREIPDARLEEIPGAGHAANQERHAEFNHALLSFLAEADARARVPGGAA